MNLTLTAARPRGPAIGWGISLLAHALLVAWLLNTHVPRPAEGPAPPRIAFVLVPPRPAPAPAPVSPRELQQQPEHEPKSRAVTRPRVAAPAPQRAAPAASDAATDAIAPHADTPAPTPDSHPNAAPGFDMAAARATARGVAGERSADLVTRPRLPPTLDPGREAREEHDKLARDIERSTKSDCKTAYAGAGLLAVIPLVRDAVTGTGCKW